MSAVWTWPNETSFAIALRPWMPDASYIRRMREASDEDIDLHIIDPEGEGTYYTHTLSRQGGRMTPYNTTVQLDFFTRYGTAQPQK